MADEPNDPPIGTAQNAADVARKAELEEAIKAEPYTHDMTAQELVDWTNRRKSPGEQIVRVFGELNSVLHSLGPNSVVELHLDYATYQAFGAALQSAYPKAVSGMKLAGISIKCVT